MLSEPLGCSDPPCSDATRQQDADSDSHAHLSAAIVQVVMTQMELYTSRMSKTLLLEVDKILRGRPISSPSYVPKESRPMIMERAGTRERCSKRASGMVEAADAVIAAHAMRKIASICHMSSPVHLEEDHHLPQRNQSQIRAICSPEPDDLPKSKFSLDSITASQTSLQHSGQRHQKKVSIDSAPLELMLLDVCQEKDKSSQPEEPHHTKMPKEEGSMRFHHCSEKVRNVNLKQEGLLMNLRRAASVILPMDHTTPGFAQILPIEEQEGKWEADKAKSVSAIWRRQAVVLADQFRQEMSDVVEFKKRGMSFRGGLWWLRHLVGVRALSQPMRALRISCLFILFGIASEMVFTYLQFVEIEPSHKPVLFHALQLIFLVSATTGLLSHHLAYRCSDNTLSPGAQDGLLKAHSSAFEYIEPWLTSSRQKGEFLLFLWLLSLVAVMASLIYNTYSLERVTLGVRVGFCLSGFFAFTVSSAASCALSMRMVHVSTAMTSSIISFVTGFASAPLNYLDLLLEWNTIQIFVRSMSDGCSASLVCLLVCFPLMVCALLAQVWLFQVESITLVLSVLPFVLLAAMPAYALLSAAEVTMQCDHTPQAANSMMVGEFGNPLAQELLSFMDRCNLGFYLKDARVTYTSISKAGYIFAALLFSAGLAQIKSHSV